MGGPHRPIKKGKGSRGRRPEEKSDIFPKKLDNFLIRAKGVSKKQVADLIWELNRHKSGINASMGIIPPEVQAHIDGLKSYANIVLDFIAKNAINKGTAYDAQEILKHRLAKR